MRLGVLAAAMAMVVIPALGAHAEDQRGTLTIAGTERSFVLHVPPGAEAKPLPLVIALHGAGGTGADFAAETKFDPAADAAGMMVVYPDGMVAPAKRGTWNARFCCGPAAAQDRDDVGFIGALIEALAKQHQIDRKRIYATGMSNGGIFAFRLASLRPQWFAAVAGVSAAIAGVARDGKAYIFDPPAEPVPVMLIHGRQDELILYDGGSSPSLKFSNHWKNSVADSLSFWAAADDCPVEPKTADYAAGRLTLIDYQGCKKGSEVLLWTIADGDHSWPAPDVPFPGPDGPRSAAAEILAFFAAHARE
ncbi:MAG TPA: PHB depolymerase family esterase, partial [Stellaceae bacterium]|nr:PHB depolymerase family esterase [Stellaceae bacterium]